MSNLNSQDFPVGLVLWQFEIKLYNFDMSYESKICKCNGQDFFQSYEKTALMGPLESPKRWASLLGTMALCFAKVLASNQTFSPWVAWECSRILAWSSVGILSEFPTWSKLQAGLGLEHFLSWKQKKKQCFFVRLMENNFMIGVLSLQQKIPALVKSMAPATGLSFRFLMVRLQVGVPRVEVSGLFFKTIILLMAACRSLGFALQGVKFGMESGTVPSMMWISVLLKNLVTNWTIFKTSVIVSLAPLMPCSTKLLFTKLVEKLASWDKTLWNMVKNKWQLGNSIADIIVPLDEFRIFDALHCLDASSIKQRDRISWPDIKKERWQHNKKVRKSWQCSPCYWFYTSLWWLSSMLCNGIQKNWTHAHFLQTVWPCNKHWYS